MDVTVVGAGITGLALAHQLAERGVAVRVLEAAAEPGGAITSTRVDGRVLEGGPQRTRLTPAVRELVAAAGLEDELRRAPSAPLYVYHDGELRRAPTTPRAALATDLLSWRGKLRMLAEPLADGPRPRDSVADYFARAFGREAAGRFLGPLFAGLYAGDPAAMPARHTVARALDARGLADRSLLAYALRMTLRRSLGIAAERPPAISFDDGLQALPRALAENPGDRVRVETPVIRLERAPDGGLAVVTAGERYWSDRVVLTVPAPTAGSVIRGLAPGAADALAGLTYNPLAVVHLDAEGTLEAAGYQVGPDAGLHTRGVTSNAHLFDREGVHTAFLGGAGDRELVDRDDGWLGETAAREFETVTGIDASVLAVERVRPGMPAYDGTWDGLDDVSLPDGVVCCGNWCGRAGIPGRLRRARALAESLASEAPQGSLQRAAGPVLA